MATKEATKKKSSKRRKGSSKSKSGLFGLGSVAKTFKVSKLMEIAKSGVMLLAGYAIANVAGKAVAQAVNKDEQNPTGLRKYINALAQGTIAAVCVSMGGKKVWLRRIGEGAALATMQTAVETVSGKSVLEMLSFGKSKATNGVEGLGASEDLILPELTGAEEDPIEGADEDPIEGANDEPIEGADEDVEGVEDDFEGVDDDFEGIDDDDDYGISGDEIE